jgi:hypothetical protein
VQQQLDPSNEELVREKFVASYDYPLDATGKWTGLIRWWPGPKWIYDQDQKNKRQKSENSRPCFHAIDSNSEVTDTSLPPQLSLPLLRSPTLDLEEQYTQRVMSFYSKLGQERPSREKIRAGVKVLQNLVNDQRYSIDEIDFVLDWVVDNLESKLGGRIQSLGIIPHVIGEALREKMVRDRRRAKTCARFEAERRVHEQEDLNKKVETQLGTLPTESRQKLREEAISHLLEQGIPKRFLLDGLVKMEMGRLLAQENVDTA